MTKSEILSYVMDSPQDTNPSILKDLLDEYADSIQKFTKTPPVKVEDYLYTIECDKVNYAAAEEYFKKFKVELGGCSSVHNGNFYGRNYDWYYDNSVSFVIKATDPSYHKSIGVASLQTLDREYVESGRWHDMYEVMPVMILDGINDAGVVCNTNVVPNGDKGITTGTNPGKENLCVLGICRYVLDHANSAADAVEKLSNMNIWAPHSKAFDQELHFMVADSEDTYVIEFVDNKMVVVEDQKIMTNFYIYGVEFNEDGSVYTPATQTEEANAIITNKITKFGEGLERYNIINNEIDSIESVEDMEDLMTSIFFSQAYAENPDENSWYTELVGARGLTCASPADEYFPVMVLFYQMYLRRSRNVPETWQTVHSSVYDMENFELNVCVQEGSTWHNYKLND